MEIKKEFQTVIYCAVKKMSFKTIELLIKLSNLGDAKSQYQLGLYYANGTGVKKDIKRAIKLFSKAAKQGHNKALTTLSYYHFKGVCVSKNQEKALELITEFIKLNGLNEQEVRELLPQIRAESLYFQQPTIVCAETKYKQDFNMIFKNTILEKTGLEYTYASNFSSKIHEVVKNYLDVKNVLGKNREKLLSRANAGDVKARFRIAELYWNFPSNHKSEKRHTRIAIEWFNKSADLNYVNACYRLGEIFSDGIKVKKNLKKAIAWYTKGAELKHLDSQYMLGTYYLYGIVEKDYIKAIYWFKKLANRGYIKAIHALGYCYFHGLGVEQNCKIALDYYLKSARLGYLSSQIELAFHYKEGDGIKKDYKKSWFWYSQAAKQDDEGVTQYQLGLFYLDGTGVEKNGQKVVYWYKSAANLGYKPADFQLNYLKHTDDVMAKLID